MFSRGVEVKACVLIRDDHAVIRRMLHALFEAHDMEVCEAENGAEGIQKALEFNPRLVILDLSMPVMNGLVAARALHLSMPHLPIVMFTNNLGAVVEQEARSAGIRAVVSKSDPESPRICYRARALGTGPSAHCRSLGGQTSEITSHMPPSGQRRSLQSTVASAPS